MAQLLQDTSVQRIVHNCHHICGFLHVIWAIDIPGGALFDTQVSKLMLLLHICRHALWCLHAAQLLVASAGLCLHLVGNTIASSNYCLLQYVAGLRIVMTCMFLYGGSHIIHVHWYPNKHIEVNALR